MNSYFIKRLTCHNFRNLKNDVFHFSENINCIFGKNGNGKTNLLEAVYYFIKRKSFRKNTTFQQILSIDCEKAEILISALYNKDNEDISISGKINSLGAEWYKNNNSYKPKPDISVVFINPFDSFQFHTISAFRRTWVDQHLSMLSPAFKKCLSNYSKLLKQKNSLLNKKPNAYIEQVKAVNPLLAEMIYELTQHKIAFIKDLNPYNSEVFKKLFFEDNKLELILESHFKNLSKEQVRLFVESKLEKEIMAGVSLCGSHKDNYTFLFNEINSFDYCSLGQQKMSFLSLIFAYIELFGYKFRTYPIVLIDDVSGELDVTRWSNLISYLSQKKFQVIITTANDQFKLELEKVESSKHLNLDNGKVS